MRTTLDLLVALVAGVVAGAAVALLVVAPLRRTLDARPLVERAEPEPEPAAESVGAITVLDVLDAGRPDADPDAGRRPPLGPRALAVAAALGAGLVVAAGELVAPRLLDLAGLPSSTLRWVGVVVLLAAGLLTLLPGPAATASRLLGRAAPRRVEETTGGVAAAAGAVGGLAMLGVLGPLLSLLAPRSAASDVRLLAPALGLAAGAAVGVAVALLRSRALPQGARVGGPVLAAALALAVAVAVAPPAVRAPDTSSGASATPSAPGAPAEPADGVPTATESYTALGGGGRLTTATGPENARLSRCVPGSPELADCGRAPRLRYEGWINLVGDRIPRLSGRPTLLTFFSASCLACVRDLARTSALADAYPDAQFLGVHSAEYPLETREVVQQALTRTEVRYPVALDTDTETLDAYRSPGWPAHFLVDSSGTVRAVGLGAGGLETLETGLRRLLAEESGDASLPAPVLQGSPGLALIGRTPSIRLWPNQAGYAGAPQYLSTDARRYTLLDAQPPNTFGLDGAWDVRRDSISADSATSRLRLRYRASRVEAIVTGEGGITVIDEDGFRTLPVRGPGGLLPLVESDSAGDRSLVLLPSPGVRLWGLAFE
ncbi:redoxin domain-containing protein [Nocardioides sp. TRM66260-LWL]|uniref:redoxin domain-containing protein n=1 Tax=Nocardioides sp. TRM66260-LWL TaxID=2874478 RepID=UPI001CC6F227|nr:redoxin domain-containing protein [Nocardioides sp. TRM66260-LWL]MBZ5734674.1 redoxin domain-containing protein [Nocardioides sp. TRM66260-LWL]